MENYKHYLVFVVFGLLNIGPVLSQNATSPDPRCPVVDKNQPGICDFMCYDGPEKHMRDALSCPKGEICCPTSCDGRSCVSLQDIRDDTACATRRCLNGGICKPVGNSFTCECKPGYSGYMCEVFDPCDSNPCLNGGACYLDSNFITYSCYCAAGYTGKYCETNIDDCAINPCQNGGKCIDKVNGFECQCKPGPDGTLYMGRFCEQIVRKDPCAQNPCANGGYCTASLDKTSYRCKCQLGFTGKNCQISTVSFSPCSRNPCLNGGFCVPYIQFMQGQDYFCQCPLEFSGNNCETRNRLCPDGRPQHNCLINPCMYQTCPGIPGNICRPDYCGGCNARFYVDNVDVTSICGFSFSFW